MNRSVFSIFILVLGFGISLLYLGAIAHFDDREALVAKLSETERARDSAQLKTLMARESNSAFEQRVALTLPQGKALAKDYRARQIASVTEDKTLQQLEPDRAAHLYEQARTAFHAKAYSKSNEMLRRIVEDYPDSINIVESYFLLVEGLYQAKQYEACAEFAERMMTLYPESDLTGFALLRLGAVYQERDRLEDAAEIYKLVVKSYRNPKVLEQAKALLYEIQL
jgi:TolA-binding protein